MIGDKGSGRGGRREWAGGEREECEAVDMERAKGDGARGGLERRAAWDPAAPLHMARATTPTTPDGTPTVANKVIRGEAAEASN